MFLSKLREAIICLKAGRVTLPYPFAPHDPAPGFRGKISVDPDLCFGCGGCAAVCPAGVILVRDKDQLTRTLEFHWARCTYCARCQEACAEGAITLTQEFQTATNSADDLIMSLDVFMGPCQRCGRCFHPATALDRLPMTGFRADSERQRPGAMVPPQPELAGAAPAAGGAA